MQELWQAGVHPDRLPRVLHVSSVKLTLNCTSLGCPGEGAAPELSADLSANANSEQRRGQRISVLWTAMLRRQL